MRNFLHVCFTRLSGPANRKLWKNSVVAHQNFAQPTERLGSTCQDLC